jgi:DNA-binding transcriptional LysR family regulator
VRVALRQGAPDAVLDLVAKGSVDLAVAALPGGAAPATSAGVLAEALADEPLVLLVPPGDALDGATEVRLWEVRDRPFVLAEPGAALRATVLSACEAEGFGPVPLFEAGDPAAVRQLVQAGLGVSLVPASWAALGGPDVGVAAPAGPAPRHALWLLAREGDAPPVARLLHEHLRRALG